MLSFAPSARVFIALNPVDMRGSFHRLAGDVRRLGAHPLDGSLYLFVTRRRTLLRASWFDRTGWAIFAKRLERGSLELPTARDGVRKVALEPSELAMVLEGREPRSHGARGRRPRPQRRRSRAHPVPDARMMVPDPVGITWHPKLPLQTCACGDETERNVSSLSQCRSLTAQGDGSLGLGSVGLGTDGPGARPSHCGKPLQPQGCS